MTNFGRVILGATLISLGTVSLHANEALNSLKGSCRISASNEDGRFDLRLNRDVCDARGECHENNQTQEPVSAFSGITLQDLNHGGAHLDAVLTAEAGTLTCAGTVHDSELSGSFTFVPNKAFVSRMAELGITGFTSEKLEAYTLFRVEAAWVKSLQSAGVTGMNSSNVIALKIFKADPAYVEKLASMGYPTPTAEKLIALKVHGVNPDEITQVRAMGFTPSLDELIQMRIFKVTPDFIERMRAKGLNNLTISKLVQIRIFKLDE